MGNNKQVLLMVQAAIFAAVAMVLSLLPTTIGSSLTISLGMIPLTIFCLKAGTKWGLFSAFIWGLLHFVLGDVYFLGPIQVFIEYVVAFFFGGFAGVMAEKFHTEPQNATKNIVLAALIGTFARFFWHFIAGVIYWGEYAPEGWSPLFFSFVMNGASTLLTAAATAIVVVLIYRTNPKLFKKNA